MTYLYGFDWHDEYRKPIDEVDENAARELWEKGPQFSVSAGPELQHGTVPDYTLVIGKLGEAVRVFRYTEHGTIASVYVFGTEDHRGESQLFLRQVDVMLYPGDERFYLRSEAEATSTFRFAPDGWARRRLSVAGQPRSAVSQFTGVDVSDHWETPLTFGDWDRLGRAREPHDLDQG